MKITIPAGTEIRVDGLHVTTNEVLVFPVNLDVEDVAEGAEHPGACPSISSLTLLQCDCERWHLGYHGAFKGDQRVLWQ